jgi:3-deoxy-D-manno-octulosonic-acid transferase
VGETVSVLPIVERLTGLGFAVLLTSGTVTSASVVARRAPAGVVHQYAPWDVPAFVRRFLDHWRPDLALVAESELWPNLIVEAGRRGIPLALVNARLSERSFGRWRRAPKSAAAVFARLAAVIAQSRADGARYAALGAPHVLVAGNLKYDVPPPPADRAMLAALSGALAGRPTILAASTHPGEEEVVIAALARLEPAFPGLVGILAPRHPERGGEIEALAREAGLRVARRSLGEVPLRDTQLYIADTIGELGLFYRLSPVAVMGGSFVEHGGQNPIEPAKLGAAVVHGPHVWNFAEVYAALDAQAAAFAVADPAALADILAGLLSRPAALRETARRASACVGALGGAVERTLAALRPLMPPRDRG